MILNKNKIISIICFSCIILAVALCLCFCYKPLFNKEIYAESITCSEATLTVHEDEYLKNFINYIDIQPKNSNQELKFDIEENSKLQIDLRTFKIKGLSTGNESLIIKIKSAENQYISTSININILPKRFFATAISFENSTVQLNDNGLFYNNLIIEGTNVNVLPTITYSQNGIVNYDYISGKILPLAIGSTTITAQINISASQTIFAAFNVTVIESDDENIEIEATLLNNINPVTNTKFIRLDYTLKIDGEVNSNQNINIEIIENTIGAVLEEEEFRYVLYIYTGLTGKFKLKLTSLLNETYEKYVEITI